MSLLETLLGQTPQEYGDLHSAHILEIYKLYVEMADRVSSRRHSANSFFLTINTALVALLGYNRLSISAATNLERHLLVALSGMALCFLWYRIIRSYRDLNSAKFKVIHEIENHLPLRPYDAEWTAVGRGKDPKLYLPVTRIEMLIPWAFLAMHGYVVLTTIPWHKFLSCG